VSPIPTLRFVCYRMLPIAFRRFESSALQRLWRSRFQNWIGREHASKAQLFLDEESLAIAIREEIEAQRHVREPFFAECSPFVLRMP
jgi:hypothetical protein